MINSWRQEMQKRMALKAAVSMAVAAVAQCAYGTTVPFSQPFASQPPDWTPATGGGGSISYTTYGFASSVFSPATINAGVTAVESLTTSSPLSTYVENSATAATMVSTFNVYFNTSTPTRVSGADQGLFFAVYAGGNNSIAGVRFNDSGYNSGSDGLPTWSTDFSQGIYYGQSAAQINSNSGGSPNYNSTLVNGQTLSVSITTTVTNYGPDPAYNNTLTTWSISNTYTLIGPDFTFNETATSQADTDGGYNPFATPLTFDIGGLNYSDNYEPNAGGVIGDLEFSNLNVYQTVPTPEPGSLSLLALSGAALLRRRRRSRCGSASPPAVYCESGSRGDGQ
jgi:hypothetical protein